MQTRNRQRLLLLTIVSSVMLFCGVANAQYLSGPAYQAPIIDMSGPMITGASMQSYINKTDKKARGNPPRVSTRAETALDVSDNAEISRQVKRAFRDELLRQNPGQKGAVDRALATDWLAGYRDEIARPNGLKPDNLADVMTAYLIAGWAIVHKREAISPQSIRAVRDQLRETIPSNQLLARQSEVERQRMAEELMYSTVLIMANRVEISRTKNAQLADQASRHYRQVVESGMRVDLSKLALTDAGFSNLVSD